MSSSAGNRQTAPIFPFNPEDMEWHDWNGNFVIWYGQEPIGHVEEKDWQIVAHQIAGLPTFSSYPVNAPDTYANWQDWAKDLTTAINGFSH